MLNWRVLRFWEHEVFVSLPSCVESVLALGGTAEACWRVVEAVPIDDDGTTERRELCELRGRGPNTFVVVGRTTTKW